LEPEEWDEPPPPMITPLSLRGPLAKNAGVSSMCMYSASDGTAGDFHLVHLGSRAIGRLVMTEMTDVSRDGASPGLRGCTAEHVDVKPSWIFVHANRGGHRASDAHAGRKGSTSFSGRHGRAAR